MNNNFIAKVFPHEGGYAGTKSGIYNAAIVLSGLLVVVGIAFGIHAFFIGHRLAYGNTRNVPWGLLIATYVFFVVTSTGLCLVSSIGHVFGLESFKPIAKRSIFMAIVTIISGFLVIAFEIESPWRMAIYNVISPNLTSNIWWMGTLYGAYLCFMIIEFALLQMEKHKQAGFVGLLGVIAGVAAHSNLGAVFGLLNGREFWHGPYMPIYFIASAMLSGCSAIILFSWIGYKANGWKMSTAYKQSLTSVAKLDALLMAILLFFETWKVLSGIAGQPPGKYAAMMAIVSGPYALDFWVAEIGMGMVIPFIIILAVRGKKMPALFVASVLGIIGIFYMRYDLVVVGQIVPHFFSLNIVGQPSLYSYTPSLHEIMVTLAGFGLCSMLFLMGERMFRGHLSEDH